MCFIIQILSLLYENGSFSTNPLPKHDIFAITVTTVVRLNLIYENIL